MGTVVCRIEDVVCSDMPPTKFNAGRPNRRSTWVKGLKGISHYSPLPGRPGKSQPSLPVVICRPHSPAGQAQESKTREPEQAQAQAQESGVETTGPEHDGGHSLSCLFYDCRPPLHSDLGRSVARTRRPSRPRTHSQRWTTASPSAPPAAQRPGHPAPKTRIQKPGDRDSTPPGLYVALGQNQYVRSQYNGLLTLGAT
jgi:hypothetical protein